MDNKRIIRYANQPRNEKLYVDPNLRPTIFRLYSWSTFVASLLRYSSCY
ncbi:MAG: hypothetical protein MK226_07795 [Saprospiraceae bacterium]|nr:hypothetical protein [Saprospiraceae bacterium]